MILHPGRNVWRIERADRMGVLIDGAAFFRAVREALLKAERSIFIVGWDIHSQTRLVGETDEAADGYPVVFADFLSALVQERRKLVVHLLLWDYSVLYANERELFPRLTLGWNTPRRVRFSLDDAVPFGSSQHQKLIIVDDAVAFSGGLDVTIRRWDTSEHEIDNPHRIDIAGKPYQPFHDVQAVVDGAAARALGGLARSRWRCATDERVRPARRVDDVWPESVAPDFTDLDVGIARTQPRYEIQKEVREVEQLFLDSIESAEQSIYIENQFLTCTKVANKLAQRMVERPRLQALIVGPQTHASWLEANTMRNGRIRFMRILQDAGVGDRVRLVYPEVANGGRTTDTMIHSKIMVIDDRFLRIGSANLNNRSMGTDTECDLAVEAANEEQRRAIVGIRNRLMGEHCGVAAQDVAQALARSDSLVAAAGELSRNGHSLRRVEDGEPDPSELSIYIEEVADPERPIAAEAFLEAAFGKHHRQRGAVIKVAAVAIAILALSLAWHYTPLSRLAEPEGLRNAMVSFAQNPWAPLLVLASFVAAGFVAFPVTILIAATAAAFGPWPGLAYAGVGVLVSAVLTYGLGAKLGKEALRNVLGPRLNRIRQRIARRGVIAVAAIRLVPVAPFTVVNLVAGASAIRPFDYVAGTALGMLPGLIVLSLLGHQIFRILTHPTPGDVALLVAAIAAWIVVSIGVQVLVTKLGSEKP